jgi:hypothetical protein
VDLVVNLPVEQMPRLSEELARRGIAVPVDLMLDQWMEERGDVALVAYHTMAEYKAELFMLRSGDALRESALARRRRVDLRLPLGTVNLHSWASSWPALPSWIGVTYTTGLGSCTWPRSGNTWYLRRAGWEPNYPSVAPRTAKGAAPAERERWFAFSKARQRERALERLRSEGIEPGG